MTEEQKTKRRWHRIKHRTKKVASVAEVQTINSEAQTFEDVVGSQPHQPEPAVILPLNPKNTRTTLLPQTTVISIYPKEQGGIKFEKVAVAQVSEFARKWQDEDGGQEYYVSVWDKEKKTLVPFDIPDKVSQPPELYGRMHDCPAKYLKPHKNPTSEWVKPLIILGIIVVEFIAMVVLLG